MFDFCSFFEEKDAKSLKKVHNIDVILSSKS